MCAAAHPHVARRARGIRQEEAQPVQLRRATVLPRVATPDAGQADGLGLGRGTPRHSRGRSPPSSRVPRPSFPPGSHRVCASSIRTSGTVWKPGSWGLRPRHWRGYRALGRRSARGQGAQNVQGASGRVRVHEARSWLLGRCWCWRWRWGAGHAVRVVPGPAACAVNGPSPPPPGPRSPGNGAHVRDISVG